MSDPKLVPYTTNYTDRNKTTALLAVLAVASVLGSATWVNAVEHFVTQSDASLVTILGPPSPLAVFGLLFLLYDRVLWRMPLIGSGIPSMRGTWRGAVTFHDVEGAPQMDCDVTIKQTWTKLNVIFKGIREDQQQTYSSIIMAALNEEEYAGGLRYEYLVQPLPGVADQPTTIGTAYLRQRAADGKQLVGGYYNEPLEVTKGQWVRHFGAYSLALALPQPVRVKNPIRRFAQAFSVFRSKSTTGP